MKTLGCALVIIAGVVALVIVGGLWIAQDEIPASGTATFRLTAEQLAREYHDNEIAADGRYKTHVVAVSGVIRDISTDVTGKPYLLLGTRDGLGVQCLFSRDATSAVATVRVGQSVTVQGVLSSKLLGIVIIRGCTWVREPAVVPAVVPAAPIIHSPPAATAAPAAPTPPEKAPEAELDPAKVPVSDDGIPRPDGTRRYGLECRWAWNGTTWVTVCE